MYGKNEVHLAAHIVREANNMQQTDLKSGRVSE